MTLENPNVIDLLVTPEPGKLELIISDAGVTADPRKRADLLITKLRAYATYILSDDFLDKHPDVELPNVCIRVVCATPPTPDMLNITHIRPRTEPPRTIPVFFAVFDGTQMTPVMPSPLDTPHRDKILPRLITSKFLEGVPKGSPLPLRDLDETGLFIAYVEDGEDSVRFLNTAQVNEMGLSPYELHELAMENLAQTFDMEAIVRRVFAERGITCVKGMDSYDATRLLLIPGCLQQGEALVALIPDRETLTLLQVPDDDNWAQLAELAKAAASEHLLIDRPLRVTSQGFEVM